MAGPLEGIKVVEWAVWHNGPAAGYMLGDLGADVVKIEDPVRGDSFRGAAALWGESTQLPGGRVLGFETANRSKRGITLDLKQEKGLQVLYRMVEQADVFLTNFSGTLARRLKVDFETLSKHNPRLVYARAHGYGSLGPWGDRRAFDPIAQALSGAMWSAGDRDFKEPIQLMPGLFDQLGATMLAYGVMAAIISRDRQGVGQEIETSLLGSAIHQQAINVNAALIQGRPRARHSRKRARQPLSNMYQCGDGKWLMLAEPQSDRFWGQLCGVMGLAEIEKDPRFETALKRRESYAELIEILNHAFAARTRDEWLDTFNRAGCEFAYAPIMDLAETLISDQVIENQYVAEMDHPDLGKARTVGFPVRFSRTPAQIKGAAPQFGQHTEEVLQEMGYSWDDIAEMRGEGVV
jgi:crotonobetainyl-CoA:carnitine CoA-transferase CaiB-like acyl-CoA transferase